MLVQYIIHTIPYYTVLYIYILDLIHRFSVSAVHNPHNTILYSTIYIHLRSYAQILPFISRLASFVIKILTFMSPKWSVKQFGYNYDAENLGKGRICVSQVLDGSSLSSWNEEQIEMTGNLDP